MRNKLIVLLVTPPLYLVGLVEFGPRKWREMWKQTVSPTVKFFWEGEDNEKQE